MSFPTISTNFMFYLCILTGIQRVVIRTFPHLLMQRGYPLWHCVNVERLIVCTIVFVIRYALCLLLLAFYHLKDNQSFKFEFTVDFCYCKDKNFLSIYIPKVLPPCHT